MSTDTADGSVSPPEGQGMGQEVIVRGEPKVLAERPVMDVYEPQNVEEAHRLAGWLVKSQLLGSAIRTPEQALAVMMAGKELGVRSMQALRSIHIIDGKPTLAADLQLALCKRSPECRYFRMIASTDTVATYETWRTGDPEPTRYSYTIAMAQKAQLTSKQNWQRHTDAMLRARCITALARIVYPDLFMGVYDPDELPAAGAENVQPAHAPAPAIARVIEQEPEQPEPEPEPGPEPDAPQPPVLTGRAAMGRFQANPSRPAWMEIQRFASMAGRHNAAPIFAEVGLPENPTTAQLRDMPDDQASAILRTLELKAEAATAA